MPFDYDCAVKAGLETACKMLFHTARHFVARPDEASRAVLTVAPGQPALIKQEWLDLSLLGPAEPVRPLSECRPACLAG